MKTPYTKDKCEYRELVNNTHCICKNKDSLKYQIVCPEQNGFPPGCPYKSDKKTMAFIIK